MSKTRSKSVPRARRSTIRKTIEFGDLIAVLEVPAVYYADEPTEPYLEPDTVKLLTEARRHARAGNKAWLTKKGARVYSSRKLAG